jgi:hypothetical protein
MTIKGDFFGLLLGRVTELNVRDFGFELGKPSLRDHQMRVSLKRKVSVDFIIETEGGIFFLLEGDKRIPFSQEDLVNYMIILANDGRRSYEFFSLLKNRVKELEKKGLKFVLNDPVLKGKGILVSIKGKVLVDFVVCQQHHDYFFLIDEGKRMYFLDQGLIDYLLIKANGGPEIGKLMPENWQKEHFAHLEEFATT